MSKDSFFVNLSPEAALQQVMESLRADLVHDELNRVETGKSIGTLVFEKYYFRTKNRAALVVIVDDFNGTTEVRVIATGSSEGPLFNFDWGAADNFVASVRECLADSIVD